MSAQSKTFDEFAYEAAAMVSKQICTLRQLKAKDHPEFDDLTNTGLARLEAMAGEHARRRTAACGACIGCAPAMPRLRLVVDNSASKPLQ
jgi:hypothetical protein